jgi:hypothetical protein
VKYNRKIKIVKTMKNIDYRSLVKSSLHRHWKMCGLTCFIYLFAVVSMASAATRTTMVVPLTDEPSWRDFAFLAAVPTMHHINDGSPSLIALDDSGIITPEIQDYTRRYRPDAMYCLGKSAGGQVPLAKKYELLNVASGDDAACLLTRKFWSVAKTAVLCADDDYEAALVASALAARLRSPLLFADARGLSSSATNELKRLKVQRIISVGKSSAPATSLKSVAKQVVELHDAEAVLTWVRKVGVSVNYLTALNPTDRSECVIRKISLAGVLLAAGRDGLVVPLNYETRWKVPFTGVAVDGKPSAKASKTADKNNKGTIVFEGGTKHDFIVTGNEKKKRMQVKIDLKGDGNFSGPLNTGDLIHVDGKEYVITLGEKNGIGKADVRLSWPTAEKLCIDLKNHYKLMERPPEYLCIAGFPDAIPQAVIRKKPISKDLTSDSLFANADEDDFAEIGVSRIVAENASFATLYASRVLTYSSLLDPSWQNRACQGDWENTCEEMLGNVGFDSSYRHTKKDLKWIKRPTKKKKGKRAKSFDQDSPLANCAALAHMNHSWWHGFGTTYQWDSEVLLAPVVVESGGCLTAALDYEADYRTVIARLFRKGAVSFTGNSREGIAQSELQRHEFWNGVLSGHSLGDAHRNSMNSALVTMFDLGQENGGSFWYQFNIRTLFGDPAFVMHTPRKQKIKPAHSTVKGNLVSVHAPEKWWTVKMFVPPDWKQWADKDLYVLRGPGVYARRNWCREQYDREEMFMTAFITTNRQITKIHQIQNQPSPLGWNGKFYEDVNADGTRTYRWSVRMADFDQKTGKIIHVVDRIDYRVSYQ